jgi:hypothetical protein
MWIFDVSRALHQPLYSLTQAKAVVSDIEEAVVGRGIAGEVHRWHKIFRVFREQFEPLRQSPFIEEVGFFKQKVFYLGACNL